MYIAASEDGVDLRDPSDFTRFEVVASVPRDRAQTLLSQAGLGELRDDDHVTVPQDFLKTAAGDVAETQEWQDGFSKMISYAESKGWVTDSGDVLAHVVWKAAQA